jgi:hypothetical protein
MMYTAKKIIEDIEKHYPVLELPKIQLAFPDYKVEVGKYDFYQYIIGVCTNDYGNGIGNYEYEFQKRFKNIAEVKSLPYPFESNERDELKIALQQLSDHFNANIDVEDMFKRQVRERDKTYYIVVTIVAIKILYVEE